MFFVLSKTLSFLAMPLVLVILLFILSAWFKNSLWKKRFFWVAFGSMLFFTNDFLANEVMRLWEIPPTPFKSIDKTYEYAVMLTGVTNNDQQPDDRVYFSHGADRVVHAVELYKRGMVKKIVISGGTGRLLTEGRREADDIFNAMKLMGVEPSDMIIENKSQNTYQSAVNVKPLIGKVDSKNVVLVTSAFHMRRSRACFKKAGMDVEIFSTDFYTHPRYFTPDALLIPKVEALVIWHKLFKEWTGMVAYWLVGYI